MRTLAQITLPYACFGIEVHQGVVVEAAPMGRWMIGKSLRTVMKWARSKGGVTRKVCPILDSM